MKDAVDPLTLAKLRVRLDWRMFVDVDTYALIDHPNNYYCVAFAIARLRTRMGWGGRRGGREALRQDRRALRPLLRPIRLRRRDRRRRALRSLYSVPPGRRDRPALASRPGASRRSRC
ncbi:hypothetical protein ACRAWD_13885 [Caulobacter segnis]